MLVSHTHKFIYTKTLKTAGTSVEVFLEPYCRPPGEVAEHETAERITEYGIVGARGKGAGASTFRNHMPAATIKKNLDPEIWASYHKFCVVRNPYDKVVSWFWMHCNRGLRNQLSEQPFDKVLEVFSHWMLVRPELPIDRDAYTIRGEQVVDRFLRYEQIDADLAALCTDLGLENAGELGTYKSDSRNHRDRPFTEYYDKKTARTVQKAFGADFTMLGYDMESWKA